MTNLPPKWEEQHRPMPALAEEKFRKKGRKRKKPKASKPARRALGKEAMPTGPAIYKRSPIAENAYRKRRMGKFGPAGPVRHIQPDEPCG